MFLHTLILDQSIQSSAVPRDEKPMYLPREEFEWRPSPILCKRFDIVDPFMVKVNSNDHIWFGYVFVRQRMMGK
jgi:hypothetical protein